MDEYVIQAVLGLLVFAAIMFAAKYFYKKLVLSGGTNLRRSKYMKTLDKLYISNDKWIEIVQIGDKKLMLGITQNKINVLKELEQGDLEDIEVPKDQNVFASVLSKYIKK